MTKDEAKQIYRQFLNTRMHYPRMTLVSYLMDNNISRVDAKQQAEAVLQLVKS